MKCSSSVRADRLLGLSVQAGALPVRAPILPAKALAFELSGDTTQGAATMWADKIQDRRNLILSE